MEPRVEGGRMIRLAFALLLMPVVTPCVNAQPAQVVVIRHAEKPDDPENEHLSPAGVKRADHLASLVTTDPTLTKFGPPVAIFASSPTKHGAGQRTSETLAPLARALKLQVQTPFASKDGDRMAKLILSTPAYSGKTVIVAWTHDEIPKLVKALGIKPKPAKLKNSVYDMVYVVSYPQGKATLATFRY